MSASAPAAPLTDIDVRKQELRLLVGDRVEGLGSQRRAELSQQVLARLTTRFARAAPAKVAAYWSLPAEVATAGLLEFFLKQGSAVYLPAVTGAGSMEFRLWQGELLSQELAQDRHGIPCPVQGAAIAALEQLDLMLIPLRGFDASGGRLGTGGGYYDRYLSSTACSSAARPKLLGLAFDEQLLDEVPVTELDVRLDGVLTPTKLHLFSAKLAELIK